MKMPLQNRCRWRSLRALPALFLWGSVCSGAWWDDFPRMVSDSSAQQAAVVSNLHGTINMNANGQDPGWGTFFQRDGIVKNSAKIQMLKAAGLRQIGYFETFGTTYCPVAELGAWDGTNLTPVLKTHWSWAGYGGGPVRWLGAKNFFDDEEFARPYTRTHPRYGGPAMTYPDGTIASGYAGDPADPRNSRVYDAGCSKDLFGNLSISYTDTAGPTNGLVVNPVTTNYASFMMFKKDSACPAWIDYTYASTLQAADAGIDGMWSDNYGPWDSFGNPPVKLAFGDWSVAGFRSFLTHHFTAAKLSNLGVTNAATFDIRVHLKQKALGWGWDGISLTGEVWRDALWPGDQIWRAYTIYKRRTGSAALSGYYAAVKSAAAAAGNDEFLVAGNDIPGFSLGWCRGDLDLVSTELSLGFKSSNGSAGFTPPPTGRYAPFYKLAREHARSRFVNVWLYNDHYTNELAQAALCNALYYEMLATHTLPKFDPSSGRVAGSNDVNAAFFRFVEQTAPQFGRRIPVEDVGVYYSSSTLLRQFTPGGFQDLDSQPHQFAVWGWATALQELHVQYRMIPEWKLTGEVLSGLRLLIIPDAEVLDSADVSAVLIPWLDGGGRLIITGTTGKFAGEASNFNVYGKGWSVAPLTNRADVVYLPGNLGRDYYLAYTGRPAVLPQLEAAVSNALSGAAASMLAGTTASATTGITVYQDEAAVKLFVDVNNMNVDTNSWQISQAGPMTVEVVLPVWMQGMPLHVSVVSPQTNLPPVSLSPPVSNKVTVSLGSVDYYAGVIIANEWGVWREAQFTAQEIQSGVADAGQDPDGDGFSNYQEFIAGTDPTDFRCRLLLQPVVPSGLSFGTFSGRLYSVEGCTNLQAGEWSIEIPPFYGDGQMFAADLTNRYPQQFYRLKVGLP